jgi:hypothetical protein
VINFFFFLFFFDDGLTTQIQKTYKFDKRRIRIRHRRTGRNGRGEQRYEQLGVVLDDDAMRRRKLHETIDELFVQAQIIARYLIGAGHGANEEHEAAELFGAREQAQRRLAVAAEPIEQHCECRRPTNDHDAGIHD